MKREAALLLGMVGADSLLEVARVGSYNLAAG